MTIPEHIDNDDFWTALENKKPQRQWVGLTDEQILALSYDGNGFCIVCDDDDAILIFARAIEAKLKEKNT